MDSQRDSGDDLAAAAAEHAQRCSEATEYLRDQVRTFIIGLSEQMQARYGSDIWGMLTACYHEDLRDALFAEIAREIIKSMGGGVCGEDH